MKIRENNEFLLVYKLLIFMWIFCIVHDKLLLKKSFNYWKVFIIQFGQIYVYLWMELLSVGLFTASLALEDTCS